MEFNHTSVLLRETVDSVVTNPKGIYVAPLEDFPRTSFGL